MAVISNPGDTPCPFCRQPKQCSSECVMLFLFRLQDQLVEDGATEPLPLSIAEEHLAYYFPAPAFLYGQWYAMWRDLYQLKQTRIDLVIGASRLP